MREATPGLLIIPAPTMETLAISSVTSMWSKPNTSCISFMTCLALSISSRSTVKLMSLVLLRPMDWRMMSTLILYFARAENMRKAVPGLSGRPTRARRAMFLSLAMPLT